MACKYCHKPIVKPANMKVGTVYVLKTDGFGNGAYKGHSYRLVRDYRGFALRDLNDIPESTRTGYHSDVRLVADSRDVFVLGKRNFKREKANAV